MENIRDQFNNVAKKYDMQRKQIIPCFDEFYGMAAEIADTDTVNPDILDLGAGTGIISLFLYKKYPQANFTLIDIAEDMLEISRERFKGSDNFEYIISDYSRYEFNKKYDIVISGLSIHHFDENGKRDVYRNVFSSLKKNGIFINADQFIGADEHTEKINRLKWYRYIEGSHLEKEAKEKAYERMKLDRMNTIEDTVKLLKETGFKSIDVFYKYLNFAVLYCRKPL